MSTFLLVDGNSIAHRCAYTQSPLLTSYGKETTATYRFFNMLNPVMKKVKPTHMLVAWDVSKSHMRSELSAEYKSNREEKEHVYQQIDDIRAIMDLIGMPHVGIHGIEADDVIGTYTKLSGADQTYIFSGDKDLLQLLDKKTTMLYPKGGTANMVYYTPELVEEEFGVPLNLYTNLKALMGDKSDMIAGVPGCGPKKGAQLLQQYGSLQDIIDNADSLKGKLGESIRAWIPEAETTMKLVTIMRDVEVPYTFEQCKLDLDWASAKPKFQELEIESFLITTNMMGWYGSKPVKVVVEEDCEF